MPDSLISLTPIGYPPSLYISRSLSLNLSYFYSVTGKVKVVSILSLSPFVPTKSAMLLCNNNRLYNVV